MTRILTILFALAATPALAHGGAHMHPHGIDSGFGVGLMLAISLAALGAALWTRR